MSVIVDVEFAIKFSKGIHDSATRPNLVKTSKARQLKTAWERNELAEFVAP